MLWVPFNLDVFCQSYFVNPTKRILFIESVRVHCTCSLNSLLPMDPLIIISLNLFFTYCKYLCTLYIFSTPSCTFCNKHNIKCLYLFNYTFRPNIRRLRQTGPGSLRRRGRGSSSWMKAIICTGTSPS